MGVHDIVTARFLNLHQASDEEILHAARKTKRVLITRDKDFGELLFLKEKETTGVILLRGNFKSIERIHDALHRLLQEQREDVLKHSLAVVESKRYRIRHLNK